MEEKNITDNDIEIDPFLKADGEHRKLNEAIKEKKMKEKKDTLNKSENEVEDNGNIKVKENQQISAAMKTFRTSPVSKDHETFRKSQNINQHRMRIFGKTRPSETPSLIDLRSFQHKDIANNLLSRQLNRL